jgi:hypothetical protein
MLRHYRAQFDFLGNRPPVLVLSTVIHLRAEDPRTGARLARDAFEQVYGLVPEKIGFALTSLDRAERE